jgi:hypothetical protein
MLTELDEAEARGEIADIFAEIRHLYATPYVSSIHRHLATRPGVLEWAWEGVAPVFRSGKAQEAAWNLAAQVSLASMPEIPAEALAVWGVARDDIPKISSLAESFTRVAPLNLVFGGIVRDVMLPGRQARREGNTASASWTPPPALPPPPPFADSRTMPEELHRLLERFRSGTGTTAFVPGLYRMLARWPGLLAHLSVELGPRFASQDKEDAAAALLSRMNDAVESLRPELGPVLRPAPGPDESAHLQRMIDGYRVTSPEMILFGRLIRDALPRDQSRGK